MGADNLDSCKKLQSTPSTTLTSPLSGENLSPTEEPHSRRVRQRVSRACDACRKHKVKCPLRADGACQNCLNAGRPCTFDTVGIKRERPPTKRDVELLNLKIQHLEKLLAVVAPNFDLRSLPRTADQARSIARIMNARTNLPFPSIVKKNKIEQDFSADDVMSAVKMIDEFRISQESHDEASVKETDRKPQPEELSSKAQNLAYVVSSEIPRSAMAEYVNRLFEYENSHKLPLPPIDLADSLLDLFFKNVNPYENLLHRGEFMRHYNSGLAESSTSFRGLCFAVFAAGSRFSSDPRVFVLESGTKFNRQAAGAQFLSHSISLMCPETNLFTLYHLQAAALLCYITCSTCSPLTAWSSVSSHIRRAQSALADKENALYWKSSIMTDQLRKKAVWYLATMESQMCAALGRTIALKNQGMSLQLPLCVDDETLSKIVSDETFQSPNSSFDSRYLNLDILPSTPHQRAWKEIYTLKKRFGIALQKVSFVKSSPDARLWDYDRDVLLELITSMEDYINNDLVTEKLDCSLTNPVDFMLTARQNCQMLATQIMLHRLLIGSDPSEVTVCLKASNALIDILDHINSLNLLEYAASWLPYTVTPPALTLLFVARGKQHCLLPTDRANAWAGVHRCINILNAMSSWSFIAERLSISVNQLVQVCINEELFTDLGGAAGNEKKRSAVYSAECVNPVEKNKTHSAVGGNTDSLFQLGNPVISDFPVEPQNFQLSQLKAKELRNNNIPSLTSEEFFGLPHPQLDAILFEHPGRKLVPGLSSVGSPEWLNFATPTEAILGGTTALDFDFAMAENALVTNWMNKNIIN
ncbi:fungal-specific transcription factor domain-domain-containing protein [Phakopsora pachyrhizi]|uniref:Fungal-specific transcription factor domain-domain-containing protein n=1 Tax=Phakopsora pachyrhizi TaxID=170000 RepID=A0AAV0BGM1_PHAPC|nr:fungal-specific transcription factor domain-domain-containing protein [Phakopsora pachyrhizi]